MAPSQDFLKRIGRKSFLEKVKQPEDVIDLFTDNAYIGWSGFTGVGYPKVVTNALADHVENNNLAGKLRFNVFCGASSGMHMENRWCRLGMIKTRSCAVNGKEIAKAVNSGEIDFYDQHVSMFPQQLRYGFYTLDKPGGKLDVAIIEASAITPEGHIILGPAVGATPEIVEMADKIIVEINTTGPSWEGLHDITCTDLPPFRKPYLVMRCEDRIGDSYVTVDAEKVVAIVESTIPEHLTGNKPIDDASKQIGNHIINFLKGEVKAGRLPKNLLPLQSGLGNIANAVIGGLAEHDDFKHLKVWTEVLQDTFLDLFDNGTLDFATTCAIRFTPEGFKRMYDNWDFYKSRILLRSQSMANNPEVVRRLGVIALDTPVEVDIYGHANSSCIAGTRMITGLGGSNDFLRNGKYGIMHTPSTRATKSDPTGISCIVPKCTHVDSTEHDLDVVVTEQGVADLRGLSPRQRARRIIQECAHPDYRSILMEYLEKAEKHCLSKGIGHESHLLYQAYDMYKSLEESGTMKVEKW